MIKNKIVLIMLGLLAGIFIALPSTAWAADVLNPACQAAPDAAACQGNTDQPSGGNSFYGQNGILTRAARLIAIIVGIASVIMIMVGGYKFLLSSGDPSNVKSAKDTVLYAVVGLLIAAGAQSLVVFVLNRL